ncbi:hypothetical protein SRHO_G00217820 [Serrasalmus rhombeus]
MKFDAELTTFLLAWWRRIQDGQRTTRDEHAATQTDGERIFLLA